jgi:hypothetical protein
MSERYTPTDSELIRWLMERAEVLRVQATLPPDRDEVNRNLGWADQLERCAKALAAHCAHGPWVPVSQWKPVEGEQVLLKLRFEYRNMPPLIHYDVGTWTKRGCGDWDRSRVGEVLAVAHLNEDTNGYGSH